MSDAARPPTPEGASRAYKHYPLVMAMFVTVLLCSNLIGPAKSCAVHLPFALPWIGATLVFGAGNLFFPFSYIFDDVLTEVYGYAKARRVIWAGFGAMCFATLMAQVVIRLPVNGDEKFNEIYQPAVQLVFGNTWRIVVASMLAFWAGDFANSYVLAKMKILTNGRWLWTRTIGSTIVGEGLDSIIFYPLAFMQIDFLGGRNGWSGTTVLKVVAFNWAFKVLVEVLLTPVTYAVVGYLKRSDRVDHYDRGTDFNPFSLKD